jgi:predicted amidophosphoribosyltransferase
VEGLGSGSHRARNLGALQARYDTLVFLDGHVLPDDGWLDEICSLLADPTVGLAGVAVRSTDVAASVGYTYRFVDEVINVGWGPRLEETPYETPCIIACCMGVRRETFWDLGGFDGGCVRWGVEDIELSLRAWWMGYRCMVSPRAQVGHRFKQGADRGFTIGWEDFDYNLLRCVLTHFSPERVHAMVAGLRQHESFPRSLQKIRDDVDFWERRRQLWRRYVRDDAWYFNRFAIELVPFEARLAEIRKKEGLAMAMLGGNIIVCWQCGASNAGTQTNCLLCQAPLIRAQAPPSLPPPIVPPAPPVGVAPPALEGILACSRCGVTQPPGRKFCANCGAPMSPTVVTATPPMATASPPAPTITTAPSVAPALTPPQVRLVTTPVAAPATPIGTLPPAGATATCQQCGAPMPPGARFCRNCGARPQAPAAPPILPAASPSVPAPVTPSQPETPSITGETCQQCGAPMPPGARFCRNCGARPQPPQAPSIPSVVSPPVAVPITSPATTVAPSSPQATINCPRCGSIQIAGRKFCAQCGGPMPESAAASGILPTSPVMPPSPPVVIAAPPPIPSVAPPAPTPAATPPGAICRQCGATVPPGARFCRQCGVPQEAPAVVAQLAAPPSPVAASAPPPPAAAACARCGAPLVPGRRFCSQCGAPVASAAVPPTIPPTPATSQCRQCGAPLRPGMQFCSNCGAKQ